MRRRSRKSDVTLRSTQTRKAIEETQAKAALENAMALVSREKARVASLEETKLQAPPHQEILNVNVLPGRYVNAGDSLVTLVNCKNLFAVAIFSYRQASSLAVGTRITISGDGIDNPVGGSVQDIIPKSNEKTDDLYAVSFPQTERREMYVVVKPDDVNALRLRNAEGQPEGSCPVGKWITVSRGGAGVDSLNFSALARGLESDHAIRSRASSHLPRWEAGGESPHGGSLAACFGRLGDFTSTPRCKDGFSSHTALRCHRKTCRCDCDRFQETGVSS